MKNIAIFIALLSGVLWNHTAAAQDDVYDAPISRPAKVNKAKPVYTEQEEKLIFPEKTESYTEENSTISRIGSENNTYYNNNNYYNNENYYSDDWNYGYTDRIRRFHNPSIQFSYGWNNWYNNYYTPLNYYNSWNSWDNFSFTPSWLYSYNNFYNPFYGSSMLFYQPGFSSWYNTGFYSPFSNWGFYDSWYGFSPYSYNLIYNYGYSNYEGYYDTQKKNVIYAPRTSGYSNSNYIRSGNTNTNNAPANSNTNFNNSDNNQSLQKQTSPAIKWNSRSSNTDYNSKPDNTYRYQQQPTYNNRSSEDNYRNNSAPAEPNFNINTSPNNNSGIKIGTRPK